MKIINISKEEYYFIKTDEEPYPYHRRNVKGDKDSWETCMSDSWEPDYDNQELEELLQEWLTKE